MDNSLNMDNESNTPLINPRNSISDDEDLVSRGSLDSNPSKLESGQFNYPYSSQKRQWKVLVRKSGHYIVYGLIALTILMSAYSIGQMTGMHMERSQCEEHIHNEPEASSTAQVSRAGLSTTCGSTNAEAIANNCTFDVITYAWTPPACYFPDLAQDVVSTASRFAPPHKAGMFKWYGDRHGLEVVPQDAIILSERAEIWATHYWHQAHCLYFWRLLSRAIEHAHQYGVKESWVLSQAIVGPHTFHCNDMLADTKKKGTDLIRTLRVYGTCVTLDATPDPSLEHGDLFVDPNEKSGAGR